MHGKETAHRDLQRLVTSGVSYFESDGRVKEIGYRKMDQTNKEVQGLINTKYGGECDTIGKARGKSDTRRKGKENRRNVLSFEIGPEGK
jgi:hypothetical protein